MFYRWHSRDARSADVLLPIRQRGLAVCVMDFDLTVSCPAARHGVFAIRSSWRTVSLPRMLFAPVRTAAFWSSIASNARPWPAVNFPSSIHSEMFHECQERTELATVARSLPVRDATSSCVKMKLVHQAWNAARLLDGIKSSR